ncbi:MAG: hypothetical protein JNM36_03695 [Chitinophagales bacterium]|nr:hypothetical protein [Chitinophagales bacterium]
MTNYPKISTTTINMLLLLALINLAYACANEKNNTPNTNETAQNVANTEKTAETIVINGTVKEIAFGKDGYTAQVATEEQGTYDALVSIVNVGGRENYQQCNVGDKVSFKGIPSNLGDAKLLTVKEILSITAANNAQNQDQDIAAKYSKISPKDYCWQTNKVIVLHTEARADSKVEGKHFAGELLQVLGTKVLENQLWVNVTYSLKVKAGYESQFADGQVMSSGSPTGWIGGDEIPEIACK